MAISVNFKGIKEIQIKKSSYFRGIRKAFCTSQKVDQRLLRFVIHGQRIADSDTPRSLDLSDGDLIDAFMEMKGGGIPKKKIISMEEVKRLLENAEVNILDPDLPEESEEENDMGALDDEVETKESIATQKHKLHRKSQISFISEEQDAFQGDYEENDIEQEIQAGNENWITTLRLSHKEGKLNKNKDLDKQIIFYLDKPFLAPVEKHILKSLVERREKHAEWEKEIKKHETKLLKVPHTKRVKKPSNPKERTLRKRVNKDDGIMAKHKKMMAVHEENTVVENRDSKGVVDSSLMKGTQINIPASKITNLRQEGLNAIQISTAEHANNDQNCLPVYEGEVVALLERRGLSSERVPLPSPTKEELKKINKSLVKENLAMKSKLSKHKKKAEIIDINQNQIPKVLIKCDFQGCSKEFQTMPGLQKHSKEKHGSTKESNEDKQECPYCSKQYSYVDQHIRSVHRSVILEEQCPICKQKVKNMETTMKAHRGICIFCPFCDYKNTKRMRLLQHIQACRDGEQLDEPDEQLEPIDLSPSKSKNVAEGMDAALDFSPKRGQTEEPAISPNRNCEKNKDEKGLKDLNASLNEVITKENSKHFAQEHTDRAVSLKEKRSGYPFDTNMSNEAYESELEMEDDIDMTRRRRLNKDQLESDLRSIDTMENEAIKGDEEIVSKFKMFMKKKTMGAKKQEGYALLKEKSTVGIYTRAVKDYILPAFHDLFTPFDSRWILDCTTSKICTFERKERHLVDPKEPIYMTSRVLKHALQIEGDSNLESNCPRMPIMCAAVQFMNFVELSFNENLNLYGRGPFDQVTMYHAGVRKFIEATGVWKLCNDEKEKIQNDNRLYKQYKNPNKDADILRRYKQFIESPERLKYLDKVMDMSTKKLTDGEWTELTKIVMGEIVFSTGCRSVVLRHLTNGAYADKVPGFNPFNITSGDCVIEEEQGSEKIFRRVNPNIPPKELACVHQQANNSAECPEMCKKQCKPDGYNIYVTWDKTQSSRGPSYLHIIKPLKDLMELYDLKRTEFFSGKSSPFTPNPTWLDDDETPFFLNSACGPLSFLDLKHISVAMNMDVTSYDFRRIVSTWGQSHKSMEIRSAEEEALQHDNKIAKTHYLQNKQLKPQTFVQKYTREENLFPEKMRQKIERNTGQSHVLIKMKEDQRKKGRLDNLSKDKENKVLSLQANRRLGPTQRIFPKDKSVFLENLQTHLGSKIMDDRKLMKPLQWRAIVVKSVCLAEGSCGESLRETWKKMYQGDLKNGIRDMRLKAKEKNWPENGITKKKDRNSWIAAVIRKSMLKSRKM